MRRLALVAVLCLFALPTLAQQQNRPYFIKVQGQPLMELTYEGTANGSAVKAFNVYNGSKDFFFTSRGELKVPGTNKCVVLKNNANGTDEVILWQCSGNAQWNEKWKFVPASNAIQHVNHGGCLSLRGSQAIIAPCAGATKWNWNVARSSSYGR